MHLCLSGSLLSGAMGEQRQTEHFISSGAESLPCLPIWPFPNKMVPDYLRSADTRKWSQGRLTLV